MLINLYPPSEDWSVMLTLQRCGQKLCSWDLIQSYWNEHKDSLQLQWMWIRLSVPYFYLLKYLHVGLILIDFKQLDMLGVMVTVTASNRWK